MRKRERHKMAYSARRVIYRPKFVGHCILKMQVRTESNLNVSEEKGLAYIQPCAAEVGKVMLESDITKLLRTTHREIIDFDVLCDILNTYKIRFSEMQCSLTLGVGRIKWRGKTISIFKKGKIKIREALNREDAMKMLQDFLRLIWGSLICEVCGQPAIYCAAGMCNKCLEENAQRELVDLEELPTGVILFNALINLSKPLSLLSETFSNILDGLRGGKISGVRVKDFERMLNRVNLLALDFMVQTPNIEQASLGFIPLGITLNLKTVFRTVDDLIKEINKNSNLLMQVDAKIKNNILEIFHKIGNLYESISQIASMKSDVQHDVKKVREILENIRRIREEEENTSSELNKRLFKLFEDADKIYLAGLRILNIFGVGGV